MSNIIFPPVFKETLQKAEAQEKGRISRRRHRWQAGFFLFVTCGVLARFYIDWYLTGGKLALELIVVGLVIGILTFPQFYNGSSVNKENPGLVDLAVAFQYGFFWQSLMPVIRKIAG